MRYHRHQAFSLVEMLVVVAIIGVLMGILLPAVGAIREGMHKAQCLNNLRSIGIAMDLYHESNKCLPINYGKLSGTADCYSFSDQTGSAGTLGRSWLVGLLPYIEQEELFNTIRFDQALNWTDTTQPVNSPLRTPNIYVAQTPILLFLCPSDGDSRQRTDRDIPGNWAALSYNAVAGSNWIYWIEADLLPNPLSVGYPHLANASVQPTWLSYTSGRHAFEPNGMDCGNGIINRGAFGAETTTHDSIAADGRSNTIAVGEVIPSLHPKKWWYWWDGSTATAAMPINFRPVQPADATGEPAMPTYAEWQRNCGFQSRHAGSCNFLMADSSAKSFDETIDIYLFRNLANFAGGDAIMPTE